MHWMPLRQIGVKIRDLDGYYLQALLDKQNQVERHMQGSTPSLLNLALERRNQLLEKAFEESKVGHGKGPWTKRLLLIGLTGAGKSSACFFLLNQSSR
jgi:predicted GTPase